MKLRTKLGLYLIGLLLVYAVIIFFVPTIVVVSDIEKVGKQIHNLIIKKHSSMVRDQEVLVEEIFQQIRSSIDASLLYVNGSEYMADDLKKLKSGDFKTTWDAATRLVSHNPNLGFLQVSSPSQKRAVVLMPAEAEIRNATLAKMNDGLVGIEVLVDPETKEKKLYLGVALPKELQPDYGHTFYALLDWKEAASEKKILKEELEKVQDRLQSLRYRLDAGQVFASPNNPRSAALNWLYKMEMIRLLTPLVVEGVQLGVNEVRVPEGLARVNQEGDGEVILSHQLIATKPIVYAAQYYDEHKPQKTAPPIAEGNYFIFNKELDHIYLANTLNLDGVFLSIGSSADKIARDFAVWSGKPILISIGNSLWMGFDGKGKRYEPNELDHFNQEGMLKKESGTFNFQGKTFFFANIAQFEHGEMGIYELTQLGGKESIASLSMNVANKMAWKISFQIFIISLVLIILIVFVLERLAMYLAVRPVVKLAEITELIVAGKYSEIKWPKMGRRSDEVATLTHSFEHMVQGLQEKEKIRSVLDKVVSKDVANEILKSQIHLGGEDRNVSVLFSDIRGFTKITEHLSPKDTIALLNSCMTKITQVIEGEGGVVDKFVGDAVMAIYGAPTQVEDHAVRCISSGILIVRAIKAWNDERQSRGLERIEMGIGINTGAVVAGNMGAEDRLNYTVLGKNVNVASRLCSIAKPGQLIISEQTLNEPNVKDSFYVEPLPAVMLKGFSEPFRIYHVIDFKWEKS